MLMRNVLFKNLTIYFDSAARNISVKTTEKCVLNSVDVIRLSEIFSM